MNHTHSAETVCFCFPFIDLRTNYFTSYHDSIHRPLFFYQFYSMSFRHIFYTDFQEYICPAPESTESSTCWSGFSPILFFPLMSFGIRFLIGISSSTSLRAPTHSDDSQRIKTPVSRSTSDTIIRSASSSAAAVVTASSSFHSGTGSIADRTAENTVQSRRKVARMLVAVVVVFAVCYIPLMILTFLKRVYGFFDNTHDREGLYAAFTVSHWLLYLNSAINPLIYNFMSERFRSEFKASLPCCFPEAARKKREARGMTVGRPTISRMHTTRTTGTTELLSRFESTTRYPSTYEFAFARDRNEFGLSRFDSRPLPKSPIIPHDAMKPRELPKTLYDTIQQETDLRMISEHASEQASEAAEISCVVPTLCTNDLPKEID
ncbi:HCRTR2 [Branchiostoma lanceolatum]|uniref:HCRTR2 protein n=1 Tax=Branchiostoma lanceolatum TaxID=7740 RepID=A0A8K0EN09_BRALA|nr:HCRTR2 [Branchiostoma lanceolatum]